MLLSVPKGMSFLGSGTVTRPGFVGCFNWQWLPRVSTMRHPSASSALMISRLFMRGEYPYLSILSTWGIFLGEGMPPGKTPDYFLDN